MHPDLEKISEAAAGLQFMSESDYPFDTVTFAAGSDLSTEMLKAAGKPPGTAVEKVELDYFFRNMTKTYEGADAVQQHTAQRFKELQQLLQEKLSDTQVYRLGAVQVEVFIIGTLPDGSYAGLHTTSIET